MRNLGLGVHTLPPHQITSLATSALGRRVTPIYPMESLHDSVYILSVWITHNLQDATLNPDDTSSNSLSPLYLNTPYTTHIYMQAYTYTYMYTYTYKYTCMHMYTYTYTFTFQQVILRLYVVLYSTRFLSFSSSKTITNDSNCYTN